MKKTGYLLAAVALIVTSAFSLTACGGAGQFDSAQEIILVQREAGSGTRGAFEELFDIKDKVHSSAAALNSTGAVRTFVASDEYSIGYVSAASADDTVKAVAVDGVSYSAENVLSGEYKIARPFLMIVSIDTELSQMSLQAQDFYSFVMSKQGQKIVTDDGLVASVSDGAAEYAPPSVQPSGKLIITGSTSVQPVMNKLAEAYKKINPAVEITVDGSGSGDGRAAIDKGTADFGIVSAALSDEQSKKYKPLKLATDGVCVIVNRENPVTSLTKQQIVDVFTGKTLTWNQVV